MSDTPNLDQTIPEEPQPLLSTADTPDSFEVSDDVPETEPIDTTTVDDGTVHAFSADRSQDALDRMNFFRGQAGVPAAVMNPALKMSADAHSHYYNMNGTGNISIHDEQPGLPGFTGADFFERAKHFGYVNGDSTNENIDTTDDPVAAVNRLMVTLNHRILMLDPAYPDVGVGYGVGDNGKNPITTLAFGMPVWKTSFQPQIVVWPPDGSTNFPRSTRGEAPDLYKRNGINPAYPVGNPATMIYRGSGKIVYFPDGMILKDESGNEVPSYKLADMNSFWSCRNCAAITSIQPLAPETTYEVTFAYSINGAARQTRTWKFSTGGSLRQVSNIPQPGLANADSAVRALWQAADGPVASGKVKRTWLYGPEIFDARYEPYQEAPGGQRVVYYLDKARLEINNPAGDRTSQWFVTSGLLTKELVSGFVQMGDSKFEQRSPAQVPVAGDPAQVNAAAPTYATFTAIASLNNDRRSADRTGQPVMDFITKEGELLVFSAQPAPVHFKQYEKTLGHNIPDVLLPYMNTIPGGWLFVLGFPITEPLWIRPKVAGIDRDVLIQLFERRALTYTPANPPDWQVEMGNIGRHYFSWRYGG